MSVFKGSRLEVSRERKQTLYRDKFLVRFDRRPCDSAIILLFQLIHVFRFRASVFIVGPIKLLKRYYVPVISSCFLYQEGGRGGAKQLYIFNPTFIKCKFCK